MTSIKMFSTITRVTDVCTVAIITWFPLVPWALFVEAMFRKPEGLGFISDLSLEFFVNITLPVALWHGDDSAFNRNGRQEYFLWVKAAGA
jgi:hypothetical protein